MKTTYINQLSIEMQNVIQQRIEEALCQVCLDNNGNLDEALFNEDLTDALNGRLCDIEDLIDITEFL